MESSLYTCIQDIQNGDREQALALLEKFFSSAQENMHSSCNQRMRCRIFNVSYLRFPRIYNSTS